MRSISVVVESSAASPQYSQVFSPEDVPSNGPEREMEKEMQVLKVMKASSHLRSYKLCFLGASGDKRLLSCVPVSCGLWLAEGAELLSRIRTSHQSSSRYIPLLSTY